MMAPWQDITHMLLTSVTSEKGRVEGGKGGREMAEREEGQQGRKRGRE